MNGTLRDSKDLSEAEYLALVEISKIWQYKTYHTGGVCRKSDLEDWLMDHFSVTRYVGHRIANLLTEEYYPQTLDFDLAKLHGLAENYLLLTACESSDNNVRILEAENKEMKDGYLWKHENWVAVTKERDQARAELKRLRETCLALIQYRNQAGALGFQLEKADDFIRAIADALGKEDQG